MSSNTGLAAAPSGGLAEEKAVVSNAVASSSSSESSKSLAVLARSQQQQQGSNKNPMVSKSISFKLSPNSRTNAEAPDNAIISSSPSSFSNPTAASASVTGFPLARASSVGMNKFSASLLGGPQQDRMKRTMSMLSNNPAKNYTISRTNSIFRPSASPNSTSGALASTSFDSRKPVPLSSSDYSHENNLAVPSSRPEIATEGIPVPVPFIQHQANFVQEENYSYPPPPPPHPPAPPIAAPAPTAPLSHQQDTDLLKNKLEFASSGTSSAKIMQLTKQVEFLSDCRKLFSLLLCLSLS